MNGSKPAFHSTTCTNTYLHKGAESAHKVGKVPSLKESSLELERDGEKSNDDVSKREISNEHVRHSSHPS